MRCAYDGTVPIASWREYVAALREQFGADADVTATPIAPPPPPEGATHKHARPTEARVIVMVPE